MIKINYCTSLSIDQWTKVKSNILNFTVIKDNKQVLIYDNWINRLVLGLPLSLKRESIAYYVDKRVTPTQEKHIVDMLRRPFALNYNPMGSGKTIEFIQLAINVALSSTDSVLVVCPVPVISQWVAQFKEWWPERADKVKAYTRKEDIHPGDIVITNYEKVASSNYNKPLMEMQWKLVGLDEGHLIKNRKAQRTVAVSKLKAEYRNVMTGTPVLRNPDDLYSIFNFLNPGMVGNSYWAFTEYFCNIEEDFYGRKITGLTKNQEHVEVLQKLLDEIGVYTPLQVAQGKRTITVPLQMDTKQSILYSKIRKLVLDELPDTLTIPNGAVLKTRLLQATSCPRVFICNKIMGVYDYPWGVKFGWIYNTLSIDPTMKIVVYSKFFRVIQQLRQYLAYKKIKSVAYTGNNSARANENSKQEFINNPEVRVIAGTIDALGTGIDGLQQVCRVCVFIDRDTRPTINAQAEDRLNRRGQKYEVLCYYLECDKTVDKNIHKVNFNRTEDVKKLLGEDIL